MGVGGGRAGIKLCNREEDGESTEMNGSQKETKKTKKKHMNESMHGKKQMI